MRSAKARAAMSVRPPGAKPTSRRTGRVGNVLCAQAVRAVSEVKESKEAGSAASAPRAWRRDNLMGVLRQGAQAARRTAAVTVPVFCIRSLVATI
ncbi:hypothetical protein D3C87_1869790 [compost metagenome]